MNCPHLAFIRKVRLKDMSRRLQCEECCEKGLDMWLCMQRCCSFVGCGKHSNNHVESHLQKTDHSVFLHKNDKQVWCFGCDCQLEEVQLSFSQDIEECQEGNGQVNSDDNDVDDVEEEVAMIGKDYFDGFEKGMKPRGLTGLTNLGNTCYMNSALQALSNCPSLMQFFLDCPGYVKNLPHANISKNYCNLVTEMWSKKRPKFVTPSEFLQCFQKLNPQFRGFRQQDTQEFLRVLMDLLHEELKESVQPVVLPNEKHSGNPARRTSSKSKRLLGGTMVMGNQNVELKPIAGKKCRTDRYNLRSFSRRKAEAMKSQRRKQPSIKNFDQGKEFVASLPSNSYSCPEFREDVLFRDTCAGNSCTEPNGPAVSMGFVNIASDGYVTETEESDEEWERSWERSMSDSEINYCASSGSSGRSPQNVEYSSIISELFNGKIRSSVQCLTCKKISSTMETFQDLSLPIPGKEELSALHSTPQCNPIMSYSSRSSENSKGIFRTIFDWFSSFLFGPRVSLEDCLAAFFSADELKGDNMYSCEHCSMLRNGMKECRVFKLPEMLCIHLKRFRHEYYHSSKISSFVSFPMEGLDVKNYLTSDFTGKCTKYDLVAIITHHGSVGGGHYVAYCKNFVTGKWYEFNDSYVTEVSASYVQSCEAYVLFYRKRGEDITKPRQKFFRISKSTEDKPKSHYISKKWMTMFYTCAEPGPISNSSFTCKHGAVDPWKQPDMSDLATAVAQQCWEFLLQKFGGGPAVKSLDVCPVCEREVERLNRRRDYEFNTLKEIFENSDSSGPQYFISLKWYKEWLSFVDEPKKEPPGPINNHRIGLQRKRVPKAAWDFLFSQYGGKPVLPEEEGQPVR